MPVNIDHVVENWQSLSFHCVAEKKSAGRTRWMESISNFGSVQISTHSLCVCFSFHLLAYKKFAKQVYCNNIALRICFCSGFFTTSIYLFASFFLNGLKLEACFLVLLWLCWFEMRRKWCFFSLQTFTFHRRSMIGRCFE